MASNCARSFFLISSQNLPIGSKRWPAAVRWVSLAVGALGMAASASSVTYSVWQTALSSILNQTSTQSNVMSQVGFAAAAVAFPAGLIYERFGSQMDALIGAILSVSTFFALSLATRVEVAPYFAKNQWLVTILWAVNGFASCFTYFSALMPNVHNFAFNHRGKIIGLLDASLSLGPTLLSVVYNTAFTDGHVETGDEGQQNLSGFFVLLAIFYAIASFSLFFFVGRVEDRKLARPETHIDINSEICAIVENENPDEDELAASMPTTSTGTEEKPPNQFSEFPFSELSFGKIIFRWNFWFFLLQFCLSANCQAVYQSNISTYLHSFNMAEHNLLFTALNTGLQAISKIAGGVISDAIAHNGRMPRAVVYLLPYALQTLALFVSIFYGDNFNVMLATCVCVGIGYGSTWSQSPALLGELFGGKYLASNFGWSLLALGILGFPLTIGFSAIYEAAIVQPGVTYCYGLTCFTWSFALLSTCSLCSLLLAVGLTQNMLRNAADRRLVTDFV